jgi:hypothetical protein
MIRIEATLVGITPLLMHNGRLTDPTDECAKALKDLTKIRKKTEEHQRMISKVEWLGGLYWDDALGCVALPADMIWAVTIEGAKKSKNGVKAKAAVIETKEVYPLVYEGPKDKESLLDDPRFTYRKRVGVMNAAVMRTRPIFRSWQLPISLDVNKSVLDPKEVVQALHFAGEQVGLGDWRPRFGRFEVTGVKVTA